MRYDFGLYPTTAVRDHVRLAVLAEHLGFDRVWVTDSPVLWRELWVTLTAIGASTRRIRLGSAVTTGLTRHPAVTVSAAMSLAELVDGRFDLGLGNGDSSLATTGGQPETLVDFRDTVTLLRGLLDGEAAPGRPGDLRMAWMARPRVPIYVAASGPRMLELAGALADGVIIMVGVGEAMVRAAIERVWTGATATGRDPSTIEIVLWTACAVSDREPEAAIASVKATVARTVIRRLPLALTGEQAAATDRIRTEYDYTHHAHPRAPHAQLVPDTLVADFALAGDTAACAERLRRLDTLGVSSVALALPAPAFEERGVMLARLATEVLPAV